jgi:dTDP-4-dehydrorhamnose reductase
LLTGKTGQVGHEVQQLLRGRGELVMMDRSQMDLADLTAIRAVMRTVKPDLVLNAAAYTAVDQAEGEPDLVIRINAHAPGVMAEEAKKLGAAMIQYSTDHVFDGAKQTPYTEDDTANPVNVYGRAKLAGEQAVQAAGIPHLILRTSWVYGLHGRNFLLTMLRLASEGKDLSVVNDQHGTPTWSRTVAAATSEIIGQLMGAADRQKWWQKHSGIYHLCSQGSTTRDEFARAILAGAIDIGWLDKAMAVRPVATRDRFSPAVRPAHAVLNSGRLARSFGIICPPWRNALSECLKECSKQPPGRIF